MLTILLKEKNMKPFLYIKPKIPQLYLSNELYDQLFIP